MAQSSVGPPVLRIGTRGSPLALVQANQVRERLIAAHQLDPHAVSLAIIRTSGDMILDRPLAEAGGKGLFTKEIEQALLDGSVDLAVHSAKDLPTILPQGLAISAFLTREDPRDALIARGTGGLDALPRGARLGTASLRRQALARRVRSDLKVLPLRGNVETRLRKLHDGAVDAIILAMAGLKRLGLAKASFVVLDVDMFLPAVGQGAIAIETRADDVRTRDLLAAVNDETTMTAVAAERAFLAVLEGSCRTPIGGHAVIEGDIVNFRGMVLRPDGSEAYETTRRGATHEAAVLGADAASELKRRAPADFFAQS
jgi:hydroxymethylbilane synthase